MASIADLTVNLALQTASFEANAKATQTTLKRLTSGFGEMKASIEAGTKVLEAFGIALSVRGAVDFVKESLAVAGSLGQMAAQAGLSTKQFQGLEFAASKTGLGIEQVDTSMARFTHAIGEAAAGNKAAIETFNRLGVGVLDANNQIRPTSTLFGEVARAIAAIPEPARRATEEVALFGRGGQVMDEFIQAFAAGKLSIEQLGDAAEKAGFAFNDNLIAKANEAQAQIEELKRQAEVFAVTWTNEFIKALQGTPNALDAALKYLEPIANLLNEMNADAQALGKSLNDLGTGRVADPNSAHALLHPLTDAEAGLNGGLLPPRSPTGPHPFSGDLTGLGVTPHNPAVGGSGTTSRAAQAAEMRDQKSALLDYIATLQQEQAELGLSDKARDEYKAMIEASAAAQKDYDDGLRASPLLTGDEAAAIKANVDQLDALKSAAADAQELITADAQAAAKALQEQAQQTQAMVDEINQGVADIGNEFADAATGVKTWGEAAKAALSDVLKLIIKIIEQQAGLSGGTGSSSGGGIGGFLANLLGLGGPSLDTSLAGMGLDQFGLDFNFEGYASGGRPSTGQPSIVGENGPELFWPDTAGTVLPRGFTPGSSGGGGGVVVHNAYDFRGSSVDQAYVQRAAQQISRQQVEGLMREINRGAPAARITGRRPK